jgi:hypothetical protein
MPSDPSAENMQVPENHSHRRDEQERDEKGRGKAWDGMDGMVDGEREREGTNDAAEGAGERKEAARYDSADYAYEYVPVVQVSEE